MQYFCTKYPGSYNTAFGGDAGYNNVSGSGNVLIGYQAGYNETGSNKLYISNSNTSTPLLYGDFSTATLTVYSNLNINNAYGFPNSDGTSGQVLTTNGVGVLGWNSLAAVATSGSYNDLTDKPLLFDGQYSSLSGAPTNLSSFTNDAGYLTSFAEVDGSVTNELQVLSISNDTIRLTNGGFVKLPAVDGSETKVVAGNNIDVTGTGTVADPYIVGVTPAKFYLGQDTLGGIVYYIYTGSDGQQHGLIVSKTETTAIYGGSTLIGANTTEDGAYNTSLMSTGAGTARLWVETLGPEWYLPSIDELILLWHNRYHVNKTARTIGSALLAMDLNYWSSTEYTSSNGFYFQFYFGDVNNNSKNVTCNVRAVKSF